MIEESTATRKRPPQVIAVFSDGTGNSAAKFNKTNVWRLYQALDLISITQEQAAAGHSQQIAFYDNGVGNSTFKPLALLGGVFGFGLKRNVLDLYTFVCRNYQDGDQIYAFGFSRGAFTIRLLVGLVLNQGLVPYRGERDLAQHAPDAYRAYRRCFNEPRTLAEPLRNLRDGVLALWRRLPGQIHTPYSQKSNVQVPKIAFVGVWDTVAAYGLPVAELTRGVDRWIWPLSMPNYVLSPRVKQARHALALDDERDTFHPLLWDEVAEEKAIQERDVARGRLLQVWFAGMHSNVGGGYPDDSLAHVSLGWMMDEAEKAGLRFKPQERTELVRAMNISGPMYDSRSGLGGYYRYQPRKLSARMDPPDPTTLMMQDPDPKASHGRLRSVKVHESVLQRIEDSPDGYAPIVLPGRFEVIGAKGQLSKLSILPGEKLVWNDVWRRRVNYFLVVGVSSLFLLMPLLPLSDCSGPQCLLSPVISAAGGFLPGFLQDWISAFTANPGVFISLAVVVAVLLRRSRNLQRKIDDDMSELWARSLANSALPASATPPRVLSGTENLIYRLRESAAYQRTFQWLKWRFAPAVSAWAMLGIGLLACVVVLHHVALLFVDVQDRYCRPGTKEEVHPVGGTAMTAPGTFHTSEPCWPTRLALEQGAPYRLHITLRENWIDGSAGLLMHSIATDPEGFESPRMAVFAPLRRSLGARWFQPHLAIVDAKGRSHSMPVEVRRDEPGPPQPGTTFSGVFKAPATGEAFMFVNDVILPWWPAEKPWFYDYNQGTAEVRIERLRAGN